ncbi:MAG: hypothetical protein H6835_17425 [Planctomycetes bacterium]|nr:hypothetical protein [Planctomycetota bacterium]
MPDHALRAVIAAALLTVLATAQAPSRFDIATFTLPDGWTMQVEAGQAVLRSPDGDATVHVGRSRPLTGTLEQLGAELLAEAAALPEHRLEVASETGRHAHSKGEWHRFVHSFANPDRPGTFRYRTMLTVAAGGRSVTFAMTTDSVAAYEASREAIGRMVDGVRMTTTERLERGRPPLTRFVLDECIDFLEWLVHAPLTEAQRATIEAEVRGFWKAKDQEEIDGITEVVAARAELAALPEAERELARQAVLDEALQQWRAEPDSASARMMLALHDATNAPIDAAQPPLTRQAIAAFGEFLVFAAGRVAGVEGNFDDAMRDTLVAGVVDGSTELTAAQREWIASMPMFWAALRVVWPTLDDDGRQRLVAQWRQVPQIVALGDALGEQAKRREAESAAAEVSDLVRRQAQLAALQTQYRVMQNVMQMQSDTMRIMSSNIGGNTTYVYRW